MVVLLVLGLILLLFPEVCPAPADAVGDASLLVGQGSAEHTVHGAPVAHLQAAAQPALVLLHRQHIPIVKQKRVAWWSGSSPTHVGANKSTHPNGVFQFILCRCNPSCRQSFSLSAFTLSCCCLLVAY